MFVVVVLIAPVEYEFLINFNFLLLKFLLDQINDGNNLNNRIKISFFETENNFILLLS